MRAGPEVRPVALVARPAALVALTALLLSPGLWLGPPRDSAVFLLAGIRIRAGYMPYKDLWDHKPPGTYVLNAVSQVAVPWLDPWLLFWLLTVVFTGAAILLMDKLLRRWLSPAAAFLWSLVCLVGIAAHAVALGGGATESFALLPLVVVLLAIAVDRPSWQVSVSVGVLLSIACLMSLQVVPAVMALFVAVVIGDRRSDGMALVRRSIAVVAGGAILPLAVAGWLLAGGAAGDAFDQIVTYNSAYRESIAGITTLLPVVALLLCCLAIPAGIHVCRMCRRPRAFDRISWVSLAWALGFAAYVGYQGRIYLHYLILLVPPLVLLAGPGMDWLVARVRSPDRKLMSLAIGLSFATALAFATSAAMAIELNGLTLSLASEASRSSGDTATWLKANTSVSASLFIWGNDPGLYISSNRPPYDRYVYEFPLVTQGYWSPDRTAALLSTWTALPPSVIVESPSEVPLFAPADDIGDPRNYDTLAPMRDFVRSHYRLAATFGDHAVYLPISGSPAS